MFDGLRAHGRKDKADKMTLEVAIVDMMTAEKSLAEDRLQYLVSLMYWYTRNGSE